jgi:hypothetical protein
MGKRQRIRAKQGKFRAKMCFEVVFKAGVFYAQQSGLMPMSLL